MICKFCDSVGMYVRVSMYVSAPALGTRTDGNFVVVPLQKIVCSLQLVQHNPRDYNYIRIARKENSYGWVPGYR